MPFQPVPNVIQAELRLDWDNQNVENVFHFRTNVTPTLAIVQLVAALVADWWNDHYRPLQSNGVTFREVYARSLHTEAAPEFTNTSWGGVTGANTSPSMPNSVTLAISMRSTLTGRSNRGRSYFIGLVEGDVIDNEVTPIKTALIVAAWQALVADANAGALPLVIVSRFTNKQKRSSGVFTLVESITIVDGIIDGQRRRLPKRGK